MKTRPTVLVIRDGWGENPHREHDAFNAIRLADTPVDDMLRNDWPTTLIRTSGEDVGLPITDQGPTMGNSEVGHQNIGAGRIVDQEVMRITRAIRDGSFFENEGLIGAFEHAKRCGGRVHIMGLLSDGKVHSDLDHLFAIIDLAARLGWPADRLFIHPFMDGRDTGPNTGVGYLDRLEAKLREKGIGRVATIIGRFYSMDRDHRWERVERAYTALTRPDATIPHFATAREAVQRQYVYPEIATQSGDEFVPPCTIGSADERNEQAIRDGDAVIFFNFRGDRPREITKAFVLDEPAWKQVTGGGFDRGEKLADLYFCGMTGYEAGLPMSAVAFHKPPHMKNILGEVIAQQGLTQFRCAETEKFPHVTFFFNDYREQPFEGERRVIVPSPRDVGTYDLRPEMSAGGVCDAVLARLEATDVEPLIIVNFANGDMVGHTGKLDAVIRAIEVVDQCVGRIVEATLACEGSLIITADHGNAEQMWDPLHNAPHTAHTNFDVPLHIVGHAYRNAALRDGCRLADVAPTILSMMDLPVPTEMTGAPILT